MIRTVEFAVAVIRLHLSECGTSDRDRLDFGQQLVDSVWIDRDRVRYEFDKLCRGSMTAHIDRFNQFKRSGQSGHLAVLPT